MPDVMVITGTRKGIGRALCEHYLAQGHDVIGCSRGPAEVDDPRYRHFELDVAAEGPVVRMAREAARVFGKVDVLINNAGVGAMNHILTTPVSTVSQVLGTNFVGTFVLVREIAKVMRRTRYGRIVNMATVATPLRLEGESIYAASKAAVVSFTEIASRELADFGITVNAVGAAPVLTDLIRSVPRAKMAALLRRQAIPRLAEMDDIINVVDFFISPRSGFVTGQVVYLGGVHG